MSQRNLVVSLSPVLVIGRRSVAGSAWRPGRWIAGREGVEARAVDLVEGFGRAAMANGVCCAGMGLRERFGDQRRKPDRVRRMRHRIGRDDAARKRGKALIGIDRKSTRLNSSH